MIPKRRGEGSTRRTFQVDEMRQKGKSQTRFAGGRSCHLKLGVAWPKGKEKEKGKENLREGKGQSPASRFISGGLEPDRQERRRWVEGEKQGRRRSDTSPNGALPALGYAYMRGCNKRDI